MRCIRCGRVLIKPAVTINTASGAIAYGSKCAKIAFVKQKRERKMRVKAVQSVDGQLELFGDCNETR